MSHETNPEIAQELRQEMRDKTVRQETEMFTDFFQRKKLNIERLAIAALILGCSNIAQAEEGQDPQKSMQQAHEDLQDMLEEPLFQGPAQIEGWGPAQKSTPETKQKVKDLMCNGNFGELIRMGAEMKPQGWQKPKGLRKTPSKNK